MIRVGAPRRHRRAVRRIRSSPASALNGGPQMVEISRDGKRVYLTNSLYQPWDEQFYPDGVRGWIAKIDAKPDGCAIDPKFFLETGALRPHQVHLEGGDASSDSVLFFMMRQF